VYDSIEQTGDDYYYCRILCRRLDWLGLEDSRFLSYRLCGFEDFDKATSHSSLAIAYCESGRYPRTQNSSLLRLAAGVMAVPVPY